MGFVDHEGRFEFDYKKDDVFKALVKAIPTVNGMTISKADKESGHILVRTGVSWKSWGENIPISLMRASPKCTRVVIISTPKTGVLFGGAFDLGKNRQNIEMIIETTSKILKSKSPDLKKNWTDN